MYHNKKYKFEFLFHRYDYKMICFPAYLKVLDRISVLVPIYLIHIIAVWNIPRQKTKGCDSRELQL